MWSPFKYDFRHVKIAKISKLNNFYSCEYFFMKLHIQRLHIISNKIVKRGITEKNIQWTACICVFAISLVELHSHLIISLQKLMSQDSQRQPYRSKSVKKKLSLSHFICLFQ